MFLSLSKTLDLFLSPLTWALGLALAAALLGRRRPRAAAAAALATAAVLWIFAAEPVASFLFRRAEASAVRTFDSAAIYDAVIVLGGGLEPDATEQAGEPELNAAGERFLRGFELLREGRARHVLLSAGTLDRRPGAVAEASVFAKELERLGIAPERIVAEARSRNTRENAVESARIVRERGWKRLVLITSAFHMERALGCFRAVGLTPDALPVDYRSYDPARRTGSWAPRSGALAASTDALHELFGRAVYRVVGYAK
jgi:uncharacterized SAM-binding protein YcdF (DUF218 family)